MSLDLTLILAIAIGVAAGQILFQTIRIVFLLSLGAHDIGTIVGTGLARVEEQLARLEEQLTRLGERGGIR